MRTIINKIFLLIFLIVSFSSCSIISDSETEKKIVGTWITTSEEYEDGMRVCLTSTETYKEDGTYDVKIKAQLTNPIYMNLGEIRYTGTWSASKTKLMCEIDKNSVVINLSNKLDASEKRESKEELLSELKKTDYIEGGEILKITETELFIRDEEDESIIRYQRVESKEENNAGSVEPKGSDTVVQSRKLKLKGNNGLETPLEPQGNNTYEAENLVDDNPSTAWGIDLNSQEYDVIWGPTLVIPENKHIDHIVIHNGYAKNSDSFCNNSRPARITLYRPIPPDTGEPEDQDILYDGPLSDTPSPQRLNINPNFDQTYPVNAICIKLYNEANDGYYIGETWPNDLCLSEIEVWGH